MNATEKCKFCGLELNSHTSAGRNYQCGSHKTELIGYVDTRSALCRERERANKAELKMWEHGVYHKPKMQAVIDALREENQKLRGLLVKIIKGRPSTGEEWRSVELEYE